MKMSAHLANKASTIWPTDAKVTVGLSPLRCRIDQSLFHSCNTFGFIVTLIESPGRCAAQQTNYVLTP